MLVGDAANQADPLNGGGIHKAMEGASLAAEAALHALALGDFSAQTLALYERLWQENFETDWKTAEFFLTVAKNPALRDFCLYLLTQIGLLTTEDPRFRSSPAASSAAPSPRARCCRRSRSTERSQSNRRRGWPCCRAVITASPPARR